MKSASTSRPARTALLRRVLRGTILAVATFCLLAPLGGATAPASSSRPAQDEAVAGIRPETRLRKLHLVRPDLIPYPIAYEVYC